MAAQSDDLRVLQALLQRGEMPAAKALADARLAQQPDSPLFREFAGLIAWRMGDVPAAVAHLRRLVTIAPDNDAARSNLAGGLISTGAMDEAAALCAERSGHPRFERLLGYIHQTAGRHAEAIAAYEQVVAAVPGDFESWNNLGNAKAAEGDLAGAAVAFQKAIDLRPDVIPIYLNASEVLAKLDRTEGRRRLMREAARRAPADAHVWTELGLAEGAARDFDAATAAFRKAIQLNGDSTAAYLELGLMLENLNRIDALGELVAEAEGNGLDTPEIGFLKAWLLRRQGRLKQALPFAEATPPTISPLRRAQLLAELQDRLGDAEQAFANFVVMNREAVALKPAQPGPTYREQVEAETRRITPAALSSWRRAELDTSPSAPVFIVGFPRSGTTLLDTLLMNMPQLQVMEELPVLRRVQSWLGTPLDLGALDASLVNAARAHYFEVAEEVAGAFAGKWLVDKFPLHMAQMPLIHRLFPDAKVILVERHPCDAVLSCFMANFQLNEGMRSFTDLTGAARTYDAVFNSWTRATDLLPINVHRIRYERMVDDLEAEMRPLLAFVGLDWDERVLDNRASAAKRDHIRTASYSQVTEPIYRRAAGRWERYRQQMREVLPILAPWAERMNYPL